MGKTSNLSKQQWNDAHYRQVKIYADKQMADQFKEACEKNGVSMSDTIKNFMRTYVGTASPAKTHVDPFATKGARRKTVKKTIASLVAVRDAEELYMERIPDNLQGGEFFLKAEESIGILDEVIDLLEQAY